MSLEQFNTSFYVERALSYAKIVTDENNDFRYRAYVCRWLRSSCLFSTEEKQLLSNMISIQAWGKIATLQSPPRANPNHKPRFRNDLNKLK